MVQEKFFETTNELDQDIENKINQLFYLKVESNRRKVLGLRLLYNGLMENKLKEIVPKESGNIEFGVYLDNEQDILKPFIHQEIKGFDIEQVSEMYLEVLSDFMLESNIYTEVIPNGFVPTGEVIKLF